MDNLHHYLYDPLGLPRESTFASISATRIQILELLKSQGFRFSGGQVEFPTMKDKDDIREFHREAVDYAREMGKKSLGKHEGKFIKRIADGAEIVPEKISPLVIEVQSDSEDALLFRYAALQSPLAATAADCE